MVDDPPPEASGPEDFLTETALGDPGEAEPDEGDAQPTFWRVVVLILVAVVALSVVFGIAR
jgi:hypothetical protein